MNPEFARRILRDHPDLMDVGQGDRAILNLFARTRRTPAGSLTEDLQAVAAGMTARESYWIDALVSACGAFIQVAGEAGRYGIDTPDAGRSRRERIESNLAAIDAAMKMAIRDGIVSERSIQNQSKWQKKGMGDFSQVDTLDREVTMPDLKDEADTIDWTASHAGPASHPASGTQPGPDDSGPNRTGDDQIAVSRRVKAELDRLLEVGSVDLDTILRRALRIETEAEIPQDGSIGYQDPGTGLILPEGLAIERTYKGVTYHARATGGGFEDASGRRFENLNQLNKTLPTGRPENAWNEWWFTEATGRLRRLNAARPTTWPRQRRSGRRSRMTEA